ncbi:hypothetical protein [Enterococcus sp. AZ103]|uniref:hypothetical protein n=1 Tax=Enterococcus sp. AZ103 TaxID=2774628 RepID=UPI003F2366F1
MIDTEISDVQLATEIVSFLPINFQECLTCTLNSLKKAAIEDTEWAFKKFMIMFYLVAYPKKYEFKRLNKLTYEFWRNKAKENLDELKNNQSLSHMNGGG